MAYELVSNRYGKSRVRLLKVRRDGGHHQIDDWTIQILLRGEFDRVYTAGDNTDLLTTDTMKNTVYSRARASGATTMEQFAMELAAFLLGRNRQVDAAEVTVESALWKRVMVDGEPSPTTFMHGSAETQTTVVELVRAAGAGGGLQPARVTSGFDHMQVLKTADSAFEGFLRDELTTLPEAADRLLGTVVQASWQYTTDALESLDFDGLRGRIRETMLRTFALHKSRSVQHTLFAMAEAALHAAPEIEAIDLLMPNKHCLLVDLARFGQDNPNEIFVPTDEPHGTIEARVRRRS